jgi:hypothetical protein
MKTTPSRYVLVAEIITIILFHAVKIRQAEKHSAEIVFMQSPNHSTGHKSTAEDRSNAEYMLVNLIK